MPPVVKEVLVIGESHNSFHGMLLAQVLIEDYLANNVNVLLCLEFDEFRLSVNKLASQYFKQGLDFNSIVSRLNQQFNSSSLYKQFYTAEFSQILQASTSSKQRRLVQWEIMSLSNVTLLPIDLPIDELVIKDGATAMLTYCHPVNMEARNQHMINLVNAKLDEHYCAKNDEDQVNQHVALVIVIGAQHLCICKHLKKITAVYRTMSEEQIISEMKDRLQMLRKYWQKHEIDVAAEIQKVRNMVIACYPEFNVEKEMYSK